MQKKHFLTITLLAILAIMIISPQALAGNAGSLEITNLSGATSTFSYQQLLAMPKTQTYAELFCYGNLVTEGTWGGVQLSYLLSQAQMSSEVVSIVFLASDGYKVSIPLDLAMQPQIIIAYEKDGQPLAEGYRLILPELNGANWIAYITTITMSTSGANYPEVVAGSAARSNINQLPTLVNSTQTPTPQPTLAPIQTTPQPTPQNSPIIPTIDPTNGTDPVNTTPPTQISTNSTSQQTPILYALAFVSIFVLLTTSYVTIRRKMKPKL